MKLKLFSLVMGLLLGVPALQAKVELPSVLASNMVLQQETSVKLWGKAKPSAQLTIKTSWNNRTVKTKGGCGRQMGSRDIYFQSRWSLRNHIQ